MRNNSSIWYGMVWYGNIYYKCILPVYNEKQMLISC